MAAPPPKKQRQWNAKLENGWRYRDDAETIATVRHDISLMAHKCAAGLITINFYKYTLPVQKAVLEASSPVLNSMMIRDFLEKKNKEINVSNWFDYPEDVVTFFTYLYTGSITLDEANIVCMLNISRMLLLPDLECHCEHYLLQKLDSNNVISTITIALNFQMDSLLQVCQTFLKNIENFLSYSSEIPLLSVKQLKRFLKMKVIKSLKGSQVGHGILHWLEHDFDSRYKEALRFLRRFCVTADMVGSLNISKEKKDKLMEDLYVMKATEIDGFVLEWSLLIQDNRGKTALYSSRNDYWGIFQLPGLGSSTLVGLFDNCLLAYSSKNYAICVNMFTKQIKTSIVNDDRNNISMSLKSSMRPVPNRYFCSYNNLYCINPIQDNSFQIGWGVYRFIFRTNSWITVFDALFNATPELTNYTIFDNTDDRQLKIASLSFKQDGKGHRTTYFIYSNQEYQSIGFKVHTKNDLVDSMKVDPDKIFENMFGEEFTYMAPTLHINVEIFKSGLRFQNNVARIVDRHLTESVHALKSLYTKPLLIETKALSNKKFTHSAKNYSLSPYIYDLSSDKKVLFFNSNVIFGKNYHPLQFSCEKHHCGEKRVDFLPNLPTEFELDFTIIPIYLRMPFEEFMKNVETCTVMKAVNLHWALPRWTGVLNLLPNAPEPEIPEPPDSPQASKSAEDHQPSTHEASPDVSASAEASQDMPEREDSPRSPGGEDGPRSPGGEDGPRSPERDDSPRSPERDDSPRSPGGEDSPKTPEPRILPRLHHKLLATPERDSPESPEPEETPQSPEDVESPRAYDLYTR
ncbi:hypothetical protein Ahia01_000966900 [Argonauta hians]